MTQTVNTNIFEITKNTNHEEILFCTDNELGLKAIIAIHNTVLGPALGGTRVWNYATESDAVNDVLRLSRGMTFKSSISGINLGGGKAVIWADNSHPRNERFWKRYGEFVDSLNGKYITAEDVGTSPKEIEYIASVTKHVSGKPLSMGGSGDPSPFTAYGVYIAMKASWFKKTGSDSLEGVRVLVQGVGHVGQYLVDHLILEGANVSIADINEANIKQVTDKHKVTVVPANDVLTTETDIYAPCALGATLNSESIPNLKCDVVCGAANNQLKDEVNDGNLIMERGILYAPDFLINAGGVINCYTEVIGTWSKEKSMEYIQPIYDKLLEIYATSDLEGVNPQLTAIKLAQLRIDNAIQQKKPQYA